MSKLHIAALVAALTGCTDVHVNEDSVDHDAAVDESADDEPIDAIGPDGKPIRVKPDAGSPVDDPDAMTSNEDAATPPSPDAGMTVPPNTVRCTLGVDCDKIAFDCTGCDDNNTCTDDVCDVNKIELSRTCSHVPITQGLCVAGVDKTESLRAGCSAVAPSDVFFIFQNGECHNLRNPYTGEHKRDVTQGFCCETRKGSCSAPGPSICPKVFP